ncbi:kinase-like domain-containing protein [Baffinella frigidus]|nr:kinase-like domain-containing protein [Cryptophyta sp. CCMP2293]
MSRFSANKPDAEQKLEWGETELLEEVLHKRSGGFFPAWKPRLLLLTSLRVKVFQESGRASAVKESVLLTEIVAIEAVPEKKHSRKFCLAIEATDARWILAASSAERLEKWLAALRTAVSSVRSKPRQPRLIETHDLSSPSESDPFSPPTELSPPKQLRPAGVGGGGGGRGRGPEGAANFAGAAGAAGAAAEFGGGGGGGGGGIAEEGVHDLYELGRVIDQGSNGKVMEGRDRRSGERVAIKQVEIGASGEGEEQMEIWLQVQHENVVRLLDFYKSPHHLYFVMELAAGRDLFYGVMEHCREREGAGGFSEGDAADLTRQLMQALRFLHLRRIVHCDLKPDNILLHHDSDDNLCESRPDNILLHHDADGKLRLKLADWGYAQVVPPGKRLHRILGTGSYMAPEVLREVGYDEKADLWSAGVILFVLLCGFPPYEAVYASDGALDTTATLRVVEGQCSRGSWNVFPSPHWDSVSRNAPEYGPWNVFPFPHWDSLSRNAVPSSTP